MTAVPATVTRRKSSHLVFNVFTAENINSGDRSDTTKAGNMSKQSPTAKCSATIQQRLQWKPMESNIFREMGQFRSLLDVYCLATGKRYKRTVSSNNRNKAKFTCVDCKQGYCYLRLHRTSTASQWVVKRVRMCNCGTPPTILKALQTGDLTALVGQHMEKKSDWKLLANSCFPSGYVCNCITSRRWYVCCKEKDCSGQMELKFRYEHGGRRYNAFCIASAVDCSMDCKNVERQATKTVTETEERSSETCPLCFQEKLDEWVKFPCSKEICRSCFVKLVQTGPSQMLKYGSLLLFEPETNQAHCYNCPFCKATFSATTTVQHHIRGKNSIGREVEVYREVEVRALVSIPYGYQSFDPDRPSHISTEGEYRSLQRPYAVYLHKIEEERLRETAALVANEQQPWQNNLIPNAQVEVIDIEDDSSTP